MLVNLNLLDIRSYFTRIVHQFFYCLYICSKFFQLLCHSLKLGIFEDYLLFIVGTWMYSWWQYTSSSNESTISLSGSKCWLLINQTLTRSAFCILIFFFIQMWCVVIWFGFDAFKDVYHKAFLSHLCFIFLIKIEYFSRRSTP